MDEHMGEPGFFVFAQILKIPIHVIPVYKLFAEILFANHPRNLFKVSRHRQ